MEELNRKFGQLKEEAKTRIKDLKALGEQRDAEYREQLTRNEETAQRAHTEAQLEREQLILDHQAEMKVRTLRESGFETRHHCREGSPVNSVDTGGVKWRTKCAT